MSAAVNQHAERIVHGVGRQKDPKVQRRVKRSRYVRVKIRLIIAILGRMRPG
jgi:hypothetical protein